METRHVDPRPFCSFDDGLCAILVLGENVHTCVDHGLYGGGLFGRVAPAAGKYEGGFNIRVNRLRSQMEGVHV